MRFCSVFQNGFQTFGNIESFEFSPPLIEITTGNDFCVWSSAKEGFYGFLKTSYGLFFQNLGVWCNVNIIDVYWNEFDNHGGPL